MDVPAQTSPNARGTTAPEGRRHELVITVVNYRTAEMTLDCLRAVMADAEGIDLHVVVLDNCSEDGSAEAVEAWLAEDPSRPVTLIRSPVNAGFTGGHNRALAERRGDFYLLLNSDAEPRRGCLAALLEAARAEPAAMAVAPRLEWADGVPQESCFRAFTAASEVMRGAQSAPVTRLLRRRVIALPAEPAPAPEEIEWVSFAAVVLPAATLERVGLLDEGYFLYFDDADYGRRLRAAGGVIRYVPHARMVHHRGGSGPVKSLTTARKRLPSYYYASRTRYFRLTRGRLGPLAANLGWFLGRGIAHCRRLAGREVPPSNAMEWRDIWTNFADPLGDSRPARKA